MTKFEYIRVRRSDGVGRVTMNRPETLNALTTDLMEEMAAATVELERDPEVGALLFDGEGRAFSSGGDLEALEGFTAYEPFEIRDAVYASFGAAVRAIKLCAKPTVAAVRGVAAGAGCEIAVACDFRIAAPSARFIETWIKLGLISPLGGMLLLPRLIGLGRATEMLMLGRPMEAEEALACGLVNRVVEDDALEEEALSLARRLAAGPPLAYRAMKEGLRRGMESSLDAEWEFNIYAQSLLLDSKDFAEGLAAMAERRRPDFKGQ